MEKNFVVKVILSPDDVRQMAIDYVMKEMGNVYTCNDSDVSINISVRTIGYGPGELEVNELTNITVTMKPKGNDNTNVNGGRR